MSHGSPKYGPAWRLAESNKAQIERSWCYHL
jgi:hypothetical protein